MERKTKGNIAELRFLLKAIDLGLNVSYSYGETARYDFITDYLGRLSRVQVKSCWEGTIRNNTVSYVINLHSLSGSYKESEVDFIAGYLAPLDLWYIIPIAEVAGKSGITIYPHTEDIYQKYRKAWELLR